MTRRAFTWWQLMAVILAAVLGASLSLHWSDEALQRFGRWPSSQSAQSYTFVRGVGLMLGLMPLWTWAIRARLAIRWQRLGWTWIPGSLGIALLGLMAIRAYLLAMPDRFSLDLDDTPAGSYAPDILAGQAAWQAELGDAFTATAIATQVIAALMIGVMAALTMAALRADVRGSARDTDAFDR